MIPEEWLSRRHDKERVRVIGKQPDEWLVSARPFLLTYADTNTAELLNAIEVLNKLGERINTSAVHSVLQTADTRLGDHNAGRIGVTAIEQTSRIKIVTKQLQTWRKELLLQRRQNVSQSV
jgi:hypothetical protein